MGTTQASPGLPGTCVAALCDMRVVFELEPSQRRSLARLAAILNDEPGQRG